MAEVQDQYEVTGNMPRGCTVKGFQRIRAPAARWDDSREALEFQIDRRTRT